MNRSVVKLIYIVIGAVYFLVPWDILPDYLGIVGRIDDLLLLAFLYLRFHAKYNFGTRESSSAKDTSRAQSQQHQRSDSSNSRTSRAEHSTTLHERQLKTLGLTSGATREQIDKQFRLLISQYHPDKVNHLGPELQKLAHEKTLEIKQAYEDLTR